ncbi:MAG: 2-polyprenylphenol hydroxylase [Alphaproteobacteria bacterium BRH_c36]|nr:MAG: 2-polyprenylphenol hydroxylase [Alphaproteobacteria bacterium BRH_c36]
MAGAVLNSLRLMRAGIVMAQHGVHFWPKGMKVPLALHAARALTLPVTILTWPFRIGKPRERRISDALASLGPSYIKLGQFLATRADVIGPDLARDLSFLQDKMAPFPLVEAKRAVAEGLQRSVEQTFATFGPPVAAASIAQVHKATVVDPKSGASKDVAVKVLRPGIERRFKADLDSYFFAAGLVEKFHMPSRRLRPMAVVANLKRTTDLEMDLRLEAAAISEMADNIKGDEGFRVPVVDWRRTSKRVLTLEWIDGIPVADIAALNAAGHDTEALGLKILRTFLRHAMRDGFFHADMHPGNLFIDRQGNVVAVDFGIMGRLSPIERKFLAEILHGLITRDFRRAAAIHFEAGYVPPHHTIETFAQAMRAIGEPIHGRTAEDISMADLLGQLFAYTELFDMETRPELILLQKSMVIVEGVARSLNPHLNMWTAAEPVAKEWVEQNLGVAGQLRYAGSGAVDLGRMVADVPKLMHRAQGTLEAIDSIAKNGVRLDKGVIRDLAHEQAKAGRWGRAALWVGALALVAIAYAMLKG